MTQKVSPSYAFPMDTAYGYHAPYYGAARLIVAHGKKALVIARKLRELDRLGLIEGRPKHKRTKRHIAAFWNNVVEILNGVC